MRTVLTFATTLFVIWLVVTLAAYVFQRQLIYLPDASSPSVPDGIEEVHYATEDGLRLTGWLLIPPDPTSVVLVAPGNAGNRGLRVPLAQGLAERGHAVLLVDYRGYGGNPGRASEEGLLADLRAAKASLAQDPRINPERIVYLGESVGTSAAAALAAEAPPLALVLRSPFSELADVGRSAYPFLPVRTLLRERHPVSANAARYDGPVLVVLGDRDRIVAPELSRQVADDIDASLLVIEGAGHNDWALLAGRPYLDGIDAHIRTALARAR